MRRIILKTLGLTIIALVLLCGVSTAAVPPVRHMISGWWNSPDGLAALPENPQVHYESGAIEQARAVAAILPGAIARVEAMHGRRFAHPVTVGVYVSRAAFAAANGTGIQGVVGTSFLGDVTLSPVLFSTQRQRLPAILTHELSHAHIQGWISRLAVLRLPNWFKEGLAVLVSGGGGAEGVSEAQARDAIRRGDHVAIESQGSLLNLSTVRFAGAPETPVSSFRTQMAYRQAELFVAFLHDTNPAGFGRMMDAILQGRPFADALGGAYAADLPALWARFVQSMAN